MCAVLKQKVWIECVYGEWDWGDTRARRMRGSTLSVLLVFSIDLRGKKKGEKLGELKIKTVLQYNYEYIAKFGLTLGVPAKHPISPKKKRFPLKR